MSGHSHWSKVKRDKGVSDQRRGKLFSKLSKEISVASRLGGGDVNFNPRLRQAVATARGESMPVDNIERAIKKGTGELGGAVYDELIYEGYGPGGVAIILQVASDNKNRTAAEIRSVFLKGHGHLGTPGSVAWMFQHRGLITVKAGAVTEDEVIAAALDAGAEDVRAHEGVIDVVTPPDNHMEAVVKALEKAGIGVTEAKFGYLPANLVPVADSALAEQALALLESLDDHEDVQHVFTNLALTPDILSRSA